MEKNLDDMTIVEKEAYCYRLLVERDRINEELRKIQQSIKENKTEILSESGEKNKYKK